MNAKPLSQSEFDRLKAEALRAEPVAKKVMLNRIELTDNSYADGVVKIDGRGVSADTSFFKGLSKILNISKGMQDDLTGESGGPSSLYPKMVEAMKNLRGGGRTVTIVGDPVSGGLMGVYDKDPGRIPNADLFRVTEGLLNRYPGLSPVEINVKDGGMGVGISLLSSADIGFGNHGGPDGGDESFRFGFTLGSSDTQTSLGDFTYRLVCANGMMGTSVSEQFKLKDLSLPAASRRCSSTSPTRQVASSCPSRSRTTSRTRRPRSPASANSKKRSTPCSATCARTRTNPLTTTSGASSPSRSSADTPRRTPS
jgi:hypothetical protein